MRIDHALFGYRDGHRLLSATVDLSSDDRRLLARQTDSPDAGRPRTWDSLLSGYPLPSGSFAISMTWPAPEMPRPGCVWTHVLLLRNGALALSRPLDLLELFHRPTGPEPRLDTITTPSQLGSPIGLPLSSATYEWACALTWAFYDPPARPVRVARVDLSDTDRHRALLTVWAAAWPSLRGSISFIDAPHTPRRLGEQSFDLQLHQTARVADGQEGERILRGVPKAPAPRWVRTAVAETARPNGLAGFLAKWDQDLGDDRGVLPGLVDLYGAFGDRADADGIVNGLGETFPYPELARPLKRALLHPDPRGGPARSTIPEPELLTALLNTKFSTAFDSTDLQIQERAKALLVSVPIGDLAEVLVSVADPRQPIAREFLDVVADSISSSHIAKLARSNSSAVLTLVRHRATLAHDPALWSAMIDPQELWRVAVAQRGARQRRSTLAAVIQSGADIDPASVTETWRNVESALLEALAEVKTDRDVCARWLAAVDPKAIATFLGPTSTLDPAFLAVAIEQLPPAHLTKLNPSGLRDALATEPSIEAAVACLAASHQMTASQSWAGVAVLAYERAVVFGRTRKLNMSLQRTLFGEGAGVPAKDAVERIARTVNQDFRHGDWPSIATLEISDRDAFHALMTADKKAILARETLVDATSVRATISSWQREILNRTVAERADRDSLFKVLQRLGREILPFG